MNPPHWGCSVLPSSLLSSHRLKSAEDSQSVALHYCAIRVKCDIFTICVFTALCKIFMDGNTLSEQTFGNIIWNEIFMYARIGRNYWKKTNKHKVPQCYTHYLYLINCLWHYHALYKAGMQFWNKPHKQKYFLCMHQLTNINWRWSFHFPYLHLFCCNVNSGWTWMKHSRSPLFL